MKKGLSLLFVISCFLYFSNNSSAQSSVYTSPCTELIWNDEFDGTDLDQSKWNYQIGDGCPNCGWGNGELQYYTNSTQNVHVENGSLFITARQESMGGKEYTSGRIRTINKGDFTFGRIEARIKMPAGQGYWPAFWMLPTDEVYGGWPNSGEIDIMEYRGFETNTTSGTLHYVDANNVHAYKGAINVLPGAETYSDAFHVFAIEWDSTSIRWYVDNKHFHTMNIAKVYPGNWPFKHRFHILLNVAMGGLGGAPLPSTVFPQSMEVDYVRVYSQPINQTLYGKKMVFSGDVEPYYTPGNPGDFDGYEWLVPAGSTVSSGQGTQSITVNWSNVSGDVVFRAGKDCDTFDISYPVTVLDRNACDILFNDYEPSNSVANYTTYKDSYGTFVSTVNSFKDAVNSSNQVMRYRKKNTGVNFLTLTNVPIESVSEFEAGTKQFYFDVYTPAEVGSIIKLHMQSSAKYTGTYPSGTRNTFVGTVTQSSLWHRVYFVYQSTDDPSISESEIDEVTFNIDPAHVDTKLFFLDNFSRVRRGGGCVTSTLDANSTVNALSVYPNPAKQSINIDLSLNHASSDVRITFCNSLGEIVTEQQLSTVGTQLKEEIKIDYIPSGIYMVKIQSENQVYVGKFVKE